MTSRALAAPAAFYLRRDRDDWHRTRSGPWPTASGDDERSRRPRARPSGEASRIARRSRWPSRPTARGLLTANQTAGTVSLVDIKNRPGAARAQDRREARRAWPSRATAVAAVVTHWYGYDLAMLDIKDDKISLCRPHRGRARAARRGD